MSGIAYGRNLALQAGAAQGRRSGLAQMFGLFNEPTLQGENQYRRQRALDERDDLAAKNRAQKLEDDAREFGQQKELVRMRPAPATVADKIAVAEGVEKAKQPNRIEAIGVTGEERRKTVAARAAEARATARALWEEQKIPDREDRQGEARDAARIRAEARALEGAQERTSREGIAGDNRDARALEGAQDRTSAEGRNDANIAGRALEGANRRAAAGDTGAQSSAHARIRINGLRKIAFDLKNDAGGDEDMIRAIDDVLHEKLSDEIEKLTGEPVVIDVPSSEGTFPYGFLGYGRKAGAPSGKPGPGGASGGAEAGAPLPQRLARGKDYEEAPSTGRKWSLSALGVGPRPPAADSGQDAFAQAAQQAYGTDVLNQAASGGAEGISTMPPGTTVGVAGAAAPHRPVVEQAGAEAGGWHAGANAANWNADGRPRADVTPRQRAMSEAFVEDSATGRRVTADNVRNPTQIAVDRLLAKSPIEQKAAILDIRLHHDRLEAMGVDWQAILRQFGGG